MLESFQSRASIKDAIAIDACMAVAQHVQTTLKGDWTSNCASDLKPNPAGKQPILARHLTGSIEGAIKIET
jgi:hypothetical protein